LSLCGATINYRLSYFHTRPEAYQAKHPDHLNDVAGAIAYLQDRYKFGGNYVIIGHSCGATLSLQYVSGVDRRWYQSRRGRAGDDDDGNDDDVDIDIDIDVDNDDDCNNEYEHKHYTSTKKIIDVDKQLLAQQLLQSTIATSQAKRHLPRLIVCTEGIYNLMSLIEEYPSYYSFIDNAFGPISDIWQEASPVNFSSSLFCQNDIILEGAGGGGGGSVEITNDNENSYSHYTGRLVLIQSSEDELLSMRQTEEFTKVLVLLQNQENAEKKKTKNNNDDDNNNVEVKIVKGKHDEVFKSQELVTIMLGLLQELKMDMGDLKSSLE